jgi:hypothetical protein
MKKLFAVLAMGALVSFSSFANDREPKSASCPDKDAVAEALANFGKDVTYEDSLTINGKNWKSSGIKRAAPDQQVLLFGYSTNSSDKFFCTYNVVTIVSEGHPKLKQTTFRIGRLWDKGESPHNQ